MDLISRLEMFWLQELHQGIPPNLILYSSEQVLEEYLTTEVQPVKRQNIIKDCLFESLLYKSLNCRPSSESITAALEILANELSMTLFKPDEENSNSITICGEVFVIDIHIEGDGSISGVNLAASEVNEIPDKAQNYLSELAKNLDLKTFEKELAMFSFLDKTISYHPQLNLFNCLLGLQKDMTKIYDIESTNNSPESALVYGHGQPTSYERNFGTSITYHASLSIDENDVRHTHYANISIHESTTNRFLPKSVQQSCFEGNDLAIPQGEEQLYEISTMEILNGSLGILVPTNNTPLSFNAAFVMELKPAVPVSLEMAKAIIGTSGIPVTDQNLTNWTGPIFEEEYRSIQSANCKFSCSSVTPKFVASKIFFSGINQILPIFKILRQAIVFKRLLSSIIQAPQTDTKTLFHLTSWSPPRFVQIYFAHKRPPFRYLVDMTVVENGALHVDVTANVGTGIKFGVENDLFAEGVREIDGFKILESVIMQMDQES